MVVVVCWAKTWSLTLLAAFLAWFNDTSVAWQSTRAMTEYVEHHPVLEWMADSESVKQW